MTKSWVKMRTAVFKGKVGLNRFVQEEYGDFGIGQLAGIVAAVVIIGVIVSTITGLLPEWIGQVWTWIGELFMQIGS